MLTGQYPRSTQDPVQRYLFDARSYDIYYFSQMLNQSFQWKSSDKYVDVSNSQGFLRNVYAIVGTNLISQ